MSVLIGLVQNSSSSLATAGNKRARSESESSGGLVFSKKSRNDRQGEDLWGLTRNKIKNIFAGCNQIERCSPMRSTYWKEYFPVKIGEMIFHQYPKSQAALQWKKIKTEESYFQYIRRSILSEKFSLSENNVIYFNKEDLADFKPSFRDGKILKREKFFKPKRYIYVYTRSQELLIAQKFETPVGRIQHSSLSRGEAVKSAGWLTFDEEGVLKEISNFTGHYLISREQIDSFLLFLQRKDVPLDRVKIVFSPSGIYGAHKEYSMDEWQLYSRGIATGCLG